MELTYGQNYYRNNKEKMNKQCAEATRIRREKAQYDIDMFSQELLSSTRSGAQKRNIKFSLTKEDIKELVLNCGGKCALTGFPLSTRYNCNMKASIDRIDSNKGYTMDNVQIVAGIINKSKSVFSLEEYKTVCRAVLKHNRG